MFWADARDAPPTEVRKALAHVTVAVGNREECEVAVGETDPDAGRGRAARRRGGARDRQAGPEGRARQDPRPSASRCRRRRSTWSTASAPATASAGRSCHGLLAGWPLEQVLRYANAAGAIVASRLECSTAMPTAAEVEAPAAQVAPTSDTVDAVPPTSDRARRRHGGGPPCALREITELRSRTRRRSARPLAAGRRAASFLPADGRLMIIAADHPARGALGGRRPARRHGAAAPSCSTGCDGAGPPGRRRPAGHRRHRSRTCCCSARWRTRSSSPR